MKALLIDHHDSFTFNLRHWLLAIATSVDIINHDTILNQTFTDFDFIVLSPGPKSPQDYPHILNWLKQKYFEKPIFGVCLGMQQMAICGGGTIEKYASPKHGKKSNLQIQFHDQTNLDELSGLQVARYHSLKCNGLTEFKTLAFIEEPDHSQVPMWIEHKNNKWMGWQFHPESFLTEKPNLFQQQLKTWIQA